MTVSLDLLEQPCNKSDSINKVMIITSTRLSVDVFIGSKAAEAYASGQNVYVPAPQVLPYYQAGLYNCNL